MRGEWGEDTNMNLYVIVRILGLILPDFLMQQ